MWEWEFIVIDATVGMLAAGVGWLATRQLRKSNPQRALMVRVLCVVLGFSAAQQTLSPVVRQWKLRRELHADAMARYGNEKVAALEAKAYSEIIRNPKFNDRLEKLHESSGSTRQLQGRQTGVGELVAAGMARLDRADLAAILEVKRTLAEGSPTLCAAFWAGETPVEDLLAGLARLNERQQTTWSTVSSRALAREIEATTPPVRISQSAGEDAMANMIEALAPEPRSAIVEAAEATSPLPNVACRGFLALAGAVKELPPEKQETLLRFMSEPGVAN